RSVALNGGELVYALANTSPGWSQEQATGTVPVVYDWTHVALVYGLIDGAMESKLYVNGMLESRVAGTGSIGDATPADDGFSVGAGPSAATPFDGLIDSLRLWSRPLSQLEIIAGLNVDPSAAAAGLQASWRFDEVDGDTLVDDGPSGIDLALNAAGAGASPERVVSGRIVSGGSLYMDGSPDHAAVLVPELQDGLIMTNALTLEAWVHPRGPGSNPTFGGMILSKEGEYSLGRMPDGRVNFAIANSSPGWTTVMTDDVIPENQWTHVALTYDAGAGEINVYLDGVLVDTRAGSGSIGDAHAADAQLRIGGRYRDEIGTNQKFDGLIDEVRVWSLARSAADIAASYDAVIDPAVAGLEAYWRFDEGPTALFFDSSPAARHGLLGSGRPWESPARADATLLGAYSSSLLQPVCSGGVCALDTDGDNVSDYTDNCSASANSGQQDSDFDGYGNLCDSDFDGSGFVNFADLVYFKSKFGTTDAAADLDSSGFVGFPDLVLFRAQFGAPPGPSAQKP
ncbi:MAG TPA: hypothetical protein ENK16_08940, partial [Chromatiales bacterium]|nr:hypothetical protein [Chromatiales bacterium]